MGLVRRMYPLKPASRVLCQQPDSPAIGEAEEMHVRWLRLGTLAQARDTRSGLLRGTQVQEHHVCDICHCYGAMVGRWERVLLQ